jgi:predicted signal transduction protein with EAL and GGDEF domain
MQPAGVDIVMSDGTMVQAAADDPLQRALDRLIAGGCTELSFHFHPIVDSDAARIAGFEALTRGPADSPLHSPLVPPRLAVGALRVAPRQVDDVRQLSAALAEPKRQAKRDRAGSGYFVERRASARAQADAQAAREAPEARETPAAAPVAQPVSG